MNFEYFGHKTGSWSAFDLGDDVKGIRNVRLDGPKRYFNSALQHARRETGNALSGGIGMHRREGTAVSGV